MKNKKIDWIIHAVYESDEKPEPIDIHTHGLEKHGIRNICMKCPTQDLVNYCGNFINNLAQSMIDGETYSVGITHMCDNSEDWNEIYDVFDLNIEKRDNGEGEEDVYVVDYWFDDIYINHVNLWHYIFDHETKKWRVFTKDEYEKMPEDEYLRRTERNTLFLPFV